MEKKPAFSTIKRTLLGIMIVLILLLQTYPLLWIFFSSFKTKAEWISKPSYSFPEGFFLGNYVTVFKESHLPRYFLNSMIIAVFALAGIVILSSLSGFALEKLTFFGRNVVFYYILMGMMVPIFIALVPMFQIYNSYGLRNTYFSLIFPQIAFSIPVSMYLYMGFFKYIPNELFESAYLDGANTFYIYSRIAMPMSVNATVTVVTFNFIGIWNEFTFAKTFVSDPLMKTIPSGLSDFVAAYGTRDWGATFASIAISIFPTLVIYFILNDRVIEGMAAGAVKA